MSLPKAVIVNKGRYSTLQWFCPACDEPHEVPISGKAEAVFGWNNATLKPTLIGHISFATKGDKVMPAVRCSGTMTEGEFTYDSACTHELAGKTIGLPSFDGEDESDRGRSNPIQTGITSFRKRISGLLS